MFSDTRHRMEPWFIVTEGVGVRGFSWHLVSRSQDAAGYPTGHRTAKNGSSPKHQQCRSQETPGREEGRAVGDMAREVNADQVVFGTREADLEILMESFSELLVQEWGGNSARNRE